MFQEFLDVCPIAGSGIMVKDFTHATLGAGGPELFRLGFSASYRPGRETIHRALDQGINYFFGFGFDCQLTGVLREAFKSRREKCVLATGAYNLLLGHPNIQRSLEKRLKQFGTEYIDVFLFLGVTRPEHFTDRVREDLYRLRDSGKVRMIGLSTHQRKFAGKLAADGLVDVLMIRYNAAHRGAEEDIFPYLAAHQPGVVSFTATRWTYLLRRPKSLPADAPVPTPGQCYRFVLSNPHVDVCMTAPRSVRELDANVAALSAGPISVEEREFLCRFGDIVHHTKKWFM